MKAKSFFLVAFLFSLIHTGAFAQAKKTADEGAAGPRQTTAEPVLYHGPLANGTLNDMTIIPADATPVGNMRDIKRPFATERVIDQQQAPGSSVIISGDEMQQPIGDKSFLPWKSAKAQPAKHRVRPDQKVPAAAPEPNS